MVMLGVSGVRRVFDDGTVGLDGVDVAVESGELVAVVGPSGSGKTTLLRVIAGLDTPDAGSVALRGVDVTSAEARDRNIAMVFQDRIIYPRRNVKRMISFPLELRGTPREELDNRVEVEAGVLGIRSLLEWDPALLSAGHQQAVQTAKALVGRPDLYLFDEPLSRLDTAHRALVRREFRTLQTGYGIAAVWVTNDREEALAICDRMVVLDKGAVVADGTPDELYERPGSMFVATFISDMDLVDVPVSGDRLVIGGGSVHCWWPGLAAYERVVVGLRPEKLYIDDSGVAGVVDHVEFMGDHYLVHVALGDRLVRVKSSAALDGPVGVAIDPQSIHLFDPATGEALLHPV